LTYLLYKRATSVDPIARQLNSELQKASLGGEKSSLKTRKPVIVDDSDDDSRGADSPKKKKQRVRTRQESEDDGDNSEDDDYSDESEYLFSGSSKRKGTGRRGDRPRGRKSRDRHNDKRHRVSSSGSSNSQSSSGEAALCAISQQSCMNSMNRLSEIHEAGRQADMNVMERVSAQFIGRR